MFKNKRPTNFSSTQKTELTLRLQLLFLLFYNVGILTDCKTQHHKVKNATYMFQKIVSNLNPLTSELSPATANNSTRTLWPFMQVT